jgi:hypothetical protein
MSRTAPFEPFYGLELQTLSTIELEGAATNTHGREPDVSRGLLQSFEPYTALNDSNQSADNPSWRRSRYLRVLRIITIIPSLYLTINYVPRYANFPSTVYHDGNGRSAIWQVSNVLGLSQFGRLQLTKSFS